jgi:hypothetical protein
MGPRRENSDWYRCWQEGCPGSLGASFIDGWRSSLEAGLLGSACLGNHSHLSFRAGLCCWGMGFSGGEGCHQRPDRHSLKCLWVPWEMCLLIFGEFPWWMSVLVQLCIHLFVHPLFLSFLSIKKLTKRGGLGPSKQLLCKQCSFGWILVFF